MRKHFSAVLGRGPVRTLVQEQISFQSMKIVRKRLLWPNLILKIHIKRDILLLSYMKAGLSGSRRSKDFGSFLVPCSYPLNIRSHHVTVAAQRFWGLEYYWLMLEDVACSQWTKQVIINDNIVNAETLNYKAM